MKKLIIIFLCCNVYTFAQNRKAQIEQLTFKLDSTNTILANDRNSLNIKIIEMAKSIEQQQNKIATTQTELISKQTEIENLNNQIEKSKNIDFEIKKWKKELALLDKRYYPCNYESAYKWAEDIQIKTADTIFSDYFYIKKNDFNKDGMIDAFVSAKTYSSVEEDLFDCSVETSWSKDIYHSVFIFSHEGEYYKDVDLNQRIRGKLEIELNKLSIGKIWWFRFFPETLDGVNAIGETIIWLDNDSTNFPSLSSTFQYNLITKE